MRLVGVSTFIAVFSAILCAQAQPEVRSLDLNGRIIHYEVRGGYAVVEGDIIIGTAADAEAAAQADSDKSPRPRAVILNFHTANPQMWPKAIMPYAIDSDVPNQQRILDGINQWNSRTQFQIVPRTNQANYVRFIRSTTLDAACSSFLGMIGGGQAIQTTDGCSAGSVTHELGHAWGIHHEQVRADRNGNVTVLYQNMDKRFVSNFDQSSSTHDSGYYDFDSIMHYPASGFTRNGLDSMETVPVGIPIGQRLQLSAGDIDGISRTYGFTPIQTTIASVPNGLLLTVDGVSVTTPKAFTWAPGSTHTVTAPAFAGTADPRYVFVRWSDSPDISHTITADPNRTVYLAIYQAQHRFSYDVSSGSGTVTAAPAPVDGYLPDRLPVRITATPSAGSSFIRWNGTTSLSASNNSVSNPDAIVQVAVANTQYLGTFTNQSITTVKSNPPGRTVIVDGVSYLTPANFAWAQGSSHSMIVTESQTFGNNTVHHEFTSWEDGSTANIRTVQAGSAPSFTATFASKYLLTTSVSGSGRITVSPSSSDGYYDAGSEVKITAIPNAGFALRYWLGDFAGGTLEQTVAMNDQHYAVAVFGTPLPFTVLSAASFLGNPQFDATGFVVAPGEIITIFGSNLGPAILTTAQLDSTGKVGTLLGGTRILFDGVPSPIVYTSANQVSAIVPFAVAGKTSTIVRTEFNGVLTAAVTISVGETAPALFTSNASGSGQIAALNQDYGVNSPSRPAEPNTVLQLYATGGGQWTEAIADGAIAGAHLVAPKAPVYASVGKLPAQILYVGTAPGLVNGALQINILLPKELIGGPAVPIQISVGNQSSAPGTTLAVR
ncbi:MAG: M12 family metallopeptidase [Candidatus Solibacter sp.]